MRSKIYLLTVVMALVIALVSLPVMAQRARQGAGNINGTVTDETGGVVPGATVTTRNTHTGARRETVTNDVGFYTVQGLTIQGLYDVSAALTGFKTTVVSGQRVSADTVLTVNIVLSVGEVTETVTVSGQASLIKMTDTTVVHQQDAEMLEVLPVQMDFFVRQSMTLINTLPGSSTDPPLVATKAPSTALETNKVSATRSGTTRTVIKAASTGIRDFGTTRARPPS